MLAAFCCKRMREGKIGVFYASLALKKKGGGGKKSDIVAGCGNKRAMVMRDHWPQCMPEFMYDMPQNMKVLSHMST